MPEARRQQAAWNKYIDFSKIKAFVNVAISPSIEWGARNIVLSAGLGGMRPNIVIMGFYNLQQFRQEQPLVDVPSPPPERKHADESAESNAGLKKRKRTKARGQLEGALPTDTCHVETRTDIQSYVMVIEDMLLKLQINLAIATGFQELELPNSTEGNTKRFIDLWPIQMSAQLASSQGDVLTTNFDTYTMIMQLGCILHTVPSWKKSYKLRVAVFVEYESDVAEERTRVAELLENLRIEAEILVFWLASGDIKSYQVIVNGDDSDSEAEAQVEKVLEDEPWWQTVKKMRGKAGRTGDTSAVDDLSMMEDTNGGWAGSYQTRDASVARYDDRLRNLIRQNRRRQSFSNLSSFGVSLGMRTQRLNDDMISRHASHASASEESDTDETTTADSNSADEGSDEEESLDFSGSDTGVGESSADLDAGGDLETGDSAHSPSPKSRKAQSKKSSSKKSSLSSKSHSSSKKILQDRDLSEEPNELSRFRLQALDDQNNLMDIPTLESDISNEPRGRPGVPLDAPEVDAVESELTRGLYPNPNPTNNDDHRRPSRSRSPGNFTSSPVAKTKVANDEAGPSIMFIDEPKPIRDRATTTNIHDRTNRNDSRHTSHPRSIYQRPVANINNASSTSPPKHPSSHSSASAASIPLSFNDLPCRAQHLILNELITQQSEDTAVVFTTLPAPPEGTYKSESDSLGYVSDLEVLCGGLPPTLLVHSNSMTVTMNL